MLGDIKDWVIEMFASFRREMAEDRERLRLQIKRELADEIAQTAAARRDQIAAQLAADK